MCFFVVFRCLGLSVNILLGFRKIFLKLDVGASVYVVQGSEFRVQGFYTSGVNVPNMLCHLLGSVFAG